MTRFHHPGISRLDLILIRLILARLRPYADIKFQCHHQIGSDCRDRTYEYAINSRGYYHSSQVGIEHCRTRVTALREFGASDGIRTRIFQIESLVS